MYSKTYRVTLRGYEIYLILVSSPVVRIALISAMCLMGEFDGQRMLYNVWCSSYRATRVLSHHAWLSTRCHLIMLNLINLFRFYLLRLLCLTSPNMNASRHGLKTSSRRHVKRRRAMTRRKSVTNFRRFFQLQAFSTIPLIDSWAPP